MHEEIALAKSGAHAAQLIVVVRIIHPFTAINSYSYANYQRVFPHLPRTRAGIWISDLCRLAHPTKTSRNREKTMIRKNQTPPKVIWDHLASGMTGLAMLMLIALGIASCGQSPSFVESKDVSKSENAVPNTDGNQGNDGSDGNDDGQPESDGGDDDLIDGSDSTGSDGQGDQDGSDDSNTDSGTVDGDGPGDDGGTIDPPNIIRKSKTFPAETFDNARVSANIADAYLTQQIELKRSYTDTSTTFRQVVRPGVTDMFTQGNSGILRTESFNQSASKPLDILVVIDNSNSMKEEQVNLSQRLLPLLSYVNDADWQIGVVTTDTSNGCLRRLIKKGDTNAAASFSAAIQAGVNGSGNERGVLQAVNGLKCASNNWVRDLSSLAILIVSDEDNCSDGRGCGNEAFARKDYLLDYLSSIRSPGVNAKVYGIFWHPSQAQNACNTALNKAHIYSELVADTSGVWGSICDADYSATLSGISQNISTILDRRFTLGRVPDSGSVEVFINDILQTSGYTVTNNVVVFDLPPADGSVVKIVYKHGATPIKKTFNLSQAPQDNTINVEINGSSVTSGFTYQPTSNSIVFDNAPADSAQIKVTYVKETALTSTFDLGRAYIGSSLRAYINNVETTDFTANSAANNRVTFNNPPPEGAAVLFTYTAVGDPILAYSFTVQGRAAQNVSVTDATTGQRVGFLYLFGVINILNSEFSEGRKVNIRYWNEARDLTEVMLPSTPVTGSVKVTGGTMVCEASKFAVTNNTVMIKNCGFEDSIKEVHIDYRYTVARYMSFVFDDPDFGNATTPLTWRVWINNKETKDFTVQGYTVSLPALLPVGQGNQVKVEVSYEQK